ncbi:MAG: twin-arginine translocase TatA/TatE family subunit [Candidatus Goldbacteria bacterium]|nr:twin-arginine translocase TatA/TatE family subunit [Candidatus Goldiibacteriota bacterium]
MSIGMGEVILILVVALLIFGAARLPEIGKALGKGIKEFKKEVRDIKEDEDVKKKK